MIRVALLVLVAAIPIFGQEASLDSEALARWRGMSDEEKARLRERLQKLKDLPREERERLKQNLERLNQLPPEKREALHSKARQLSPEEKKQYAELAGSFFRWARMRDPETGRNFPRMLYFTWLKSEKPGKIEELKGMEPSARHREFTHLYVEFYQAVLRHTAEHVRRHGCLTAKELEDLRELPVPEFWPKARELAERCRKQKGGGGPVPPRERKNK